MITLSIRFNIPAIPFEMSHLLVSACFRELALDRIGYSILVHKLTFEVHEHG